MYSLKLLIMDEKTIRNMQSVIPKWNKSDTLVHLVGFTTETENFTVLSAQHTISQYAVNVMTSFSMLC